VPERHFFDDSEYVCVVLLLCMFSFTGMFPFMFLILVCLCMFCFVSVLVYLRVAPGIPEQIPSMELIRGNLKHSLGTMQHRCFSAKVPFWHPGSRDSLKKTGDESPMNHPCITHESPLNHQ
jgi:hypothetical protein